MGASGLTTRSGHRRVSPWRVPTRKGSKKTGAPSPVSQQPVTSSREGSDGPDLHVNEVGPYRVTNVLGEGGMGAVFKAVDSRNKNLVAIKLLSSRLANDSEFVERFEREVQIILGMRHPNLVSGLDSGWCAGRPYLVMEFVAGQSLDKILDQRGVFEETHALRILREVTKGLGCVHEHGVIHRDVKPDNVLLSRDGKVKLTDFGLARAILHSRRLTRNGIALGTPDYIAPEQIECSPYADHRVDFYSLGVMYFRLLTGRAPFVAEREQDVMIKHLYDPIPEVRSYNPKISANSALLIRKMMAKKPEQRYENARVLQEDIEAILAGKSPPRAKASAQKSELRHRSHRATVLGAACLVGIVFLLFALAKWWMG